MATLVELVLRAAQWLISMKVEIGLFFFCIKRYSELYTKSMHHFLLCYFRRQHALWPGRHKGALPTYVDRPSPLLDPDDDARRVLPPQLEAQAQRAALRLPHDLRGAGGGLQ